MRRSLDRSDIHSLSLDALVVGCKEDPTTKATVAPQEQALAATASPGASPRPTPTPLARPSGPIEFTDVTNEAGIRFRHNSGAAGKKYLPETMGAGAAFLDYDNDGWQDILLVNSTNWPGERGAKSFPALYRNQQDGTFKDVTRDAGLAVELYGIGCAVGDYDNDGFADIYLTAVGPDKLFRNTGDGKFQDVTQRAGVADPGFGTSAAWFDYDRDGKLDLFVANYVEWSPEDGRALHARRHQQVLLHAAEVQGPERHALPQPRQRHLRERDAARGTRRPREQGARRRAARLQRRRPPRPLRRQRHRGRTSSTRTTATAASRTRL